MISSKILHSGSGPSRHRVHWLERERLLLYPCLVLLFFFLLLMGAWTALALPSMRYWKNLPVGHDFFGFWCAARLAADGRPEAAYEPDAIMAVHQVGVPGLGHLDQPWLHPPTFLLVLLPLGMLPYLPALVLYVAASLTFWAALVRRMFADPRAWVVAAAFPAGLLNLFWCQDGFLTAGLAGLALLALDAQPVLAGVLIGLLAIKPNLAMLFPVALLAGRRWTAFGAATAAGVGFTALSGAAFGWSILPAFLHSLTTVPALFASHPIALFWMWSVDAAALTLGMPPLAAMSLHAAVALVAAGCVWTTWRADSAPMEAKLATLSAASLLVSPYVHLYDMTWVGLAIAWLVKLGMRTGFRRGEREFLVVAWICSAWIALPFITGVQLGWLLPLSLTLAGTWLALEPRSKQPASVLGLSEPTSG